MPAVLAPLIFRWPRSLRELGQRLASFHDIIGKVAGRAFTGVSRRVNCAFRNEQYFVGSHDNRLARDYMFDRSLRHVNDLLVRMLVPSEGCTWRESHQRL